MTSSYSATFAGRAMHDPGPMAVNLFASAWQTDAVLDEMYTFAPEDTNPVAIINPMPRLPPVTRITLSFTAKRDEFIFGN